MKIEKINDNQLKIILTHEDLLERGIKLNELAYGSEKTQSLFQEMLSEAMEMYDLDFGNKPLMIEAVPTSLDSIMLIITKIASVGSLFEQFAEIAELKKYFSKDNDNDNELEIDGFINRRHSAPAPVDPSSVYAFDTLDNVIAGANYLNSMGLAEGVGCSLYRFKNIYYLFIPNECSQKFHSAISEFGTRKKSNSLYAAHLDEYAECIIKLDALTIINDYL